MVLQLAQDAIVGKRWHGQSRAAPEAGGMAERKQTTWQSVFFSLHLATCVFHILIRLYTLCVFFLILQLAFPTLIGHVHIYMLSYFFLSSWLHIFQWEHLTWGAFIAMVDCWQVDEHPMITGHGCWRGCSWDIRDGFNIQHTWEIPGTQLLSGNLT